MRAVSAVFPDVSFVPTGGVSPTTSPSTSRSPRCSPAGAPGSEPALLRTVSTRSSGAHETLWHWCRRESPARARSAGRPGGAGEVMLRFDPGEGRIATTRSFAVSEGGGEYNVARGLRRCFGLQTAIVTALPTTRSEGCSKISSCKAASTRPTCAGCPTTEPGEARATGYFVERGFGVRAALGCSDRALCRFLRPGRHRLGSRLRPRRGSLVPLRRHLRGTLGVVRRGRARGDGSGAPPRDRRLLRPELPPIALERSRGRSGSATNAASSGSSTCSSGTRRILCRSRCRARQRRGGSRRSRHRRYEPHAECSRLPDPRACCDILAPGAQCDGERLEWSLQLRDGFVAGPQMRGLEIFDRVGGGDSFASGLIYGLLEEHDVETALAYAVAHGALR